MRGRAAALRGGQQALVLVLKATSGEPTTLMKLTARLALNEREKCFIGLTAVNARVA